MYNANLSLIFLYLKQQDISKDYVLSLLDSIKKDKENQDILYNSFIGGLKFISNASFYNDVLDKLSYLIEEIFQDEKQFEKKLDYFILLKKKEIPINDIKKLVNYFLFLEENKAIKYLDKILYIVNTVRDKRIRNPLVRKLIKYSTDKTELFNLSLNTTLYFFIKEKKYFDKISFYLDKNITNIYLLLEKIREYNDNSFVEEILYLIINKATSIKEEDIVYNIISNILDILALKSFSSNKKEIVDKIYIMSNYLNNKFYSLKLSISIIILLINTSYINQANILINRLFSILYKLESEFILDIIDYLFLSTNKVSQVFQRSFLNNIISHIFSFIERINNKEIAIKILEKLLNLLSKLNFIPETKIILEKIINILSENKITNLELNKILYYLVLLDNKDIISILNKYIYILEKSKNDKRLMSLLSIGCLKQELFKEISSYVKKNLKDSVDEEYISLVIKHFVKVLLRKNDIEIIKDNLEELLDLKIDNDLIKVDVYLNIAENIIKIQDNNFILLVFNILIKKIDTIKTEFLRFDYILKIFSFLTNFAKETKFEELLYELISMVNSFEDISLKVNMYKSFMISLLKLGNKHINKLSEEIENNIKKFDYQNYKSEILSVISTSYYRTGNYSKAIKYLNQSLDLLEQINDDNIFFDTISNLLIRTISAGNSEDFHFIINKIKLVFEILETEEKKFNFLSKIMLKLKQLNVINNRYKKEIIEIIEKNMNFNNENFKIFSYNTLIYIFNNINDNENKELYINKFISFFNKINITTQNVFSLIQTALVLIKGIDKNASLLIISKFLDNNSLKNYNDAVIYLFKELSFLGSLYVSKELIERLINIISNINLKLFDSRQLYNIAISYIQMNRFDDFISTYICISDINIKNKIEYDCINILFSREDYNSLINLIVYLLDSSNNLDLLLSYVILLNNNVKEIDNIKIF
jgi:hypothetical protein